VSPSRIRPVVRGVATIEPRRIAAGRPLAPGSWEVWLRVMGLGLDRRGRLLDATRLAQFGGGPAGVVASLDQGAGLVVQVQRELRPARDAGNLRLLSRAILQQPSSFLERTAWRVYYRLPRTLQSATRATYRRVRTVLW
jgi:hypothetical protein